MPKQKPSGAANPSRKDFIMKKELEALYDRKYEIDGNIYELTGVTNGKLILQDVNNIDYYILMKTDIFFRKLENSDITEITE